MLLSIFYLLHKFMNNIVLLLHDIQLIFHTLYLKNNTLQNFQERKSMSLI